MKNSMPTYAYFQGEIVPFEDAKISVLTHGFNYGTAAFGGVRAYWNDEEEQLFIFRPYDHFRRLLDAAKILLMEFEYTPESLTEILIDLLRTENYRQENIYVRPLVYKSTVRIGVRLHDLDDDLTMFAVPFGDYVKDVSDTKVGFSSWRRIDDNMIPARGKITGAYVNSALIKTEAHLNGYDDALVLNQDGHLAEGSAANVFIIRKGVVYTTPITANILEGITRHTLIHVMREEMGLEVVERPIDRTEIYLAEEVFLCGSGSEIAAVTSVDQRPIGTGKMGPIVSNLRAFYADLVRGKKVQYRDWNVTVYEK